MKREREREREKRERAKKKKTPKTPNQKLQQTRVGSPHSLCEIPRVFHALLGDLGAATRD